MHFHNNPLKRSLGLFILIFAAVYVAPAAADDLEPTNPPVVFADFEDGTYDGWTFTGNCWTATPASEELYPGKIFGYHGKYFMCSITPRLGDRGNGHAISREFRIEKPFISFLIAGGNHPAETCINLVVDGAIIRTETGDNTPDLVCKYWNVKSLIGKKATIEVVDDMATGPRGYILVDQIVFSNTPPYMLKKSATKHLRTTIKTLEYGDAIGAETAEFYSTIPPITSSQTLKSAQMKIYHSAIEVNGIEILDNSPYKRHLLYSALDVNDSMFKSGITIVQTFDLTLGKTNLISAINLTPEPSLAPEDRALYTGKSSVYDYDDPAVKDFISTNNLTRKQDEDDVVLVRRIYNAVINNLKYSETDNKTASNTIKASGGNNGSLAIVTTALLRSQGIPARIKIGRSIEINKDNSKQPSYIMLETNADGVGWFTLDPTLVIKDPTKLDASFGSDDGRFITMHFDPDIVVKAPNKSDRLIQWAEQLQVLLWGSVHQDALKESKQFVVQELSDKPAIPSTIQPNGYPAR